MFEIGNSLREARLRQGYELADAEAGTKIRTKYLGALEDERFDLLPAETYVKGFLRAYAEYLGLDGQLYVDEFNTRYVSTEEEPTRPRRGYAPTRSHRKVESSVLLVALAGIAAATALVFVAWKWGGSEPGAIANLDSPPPATRQTSPPPSEQQTRRAVSGWFALRVTATRGNSKLTVYRGSLTAGKLLYDGTLLTGRTQQFTGKRLFVLLSNPANVGVNVDGHPMALPGDGTAPIVALATAEGIRFVRSG